jgi:lipoprotein LenA
MKKITIALMALMFIIPCGCKKGGLTGKDSVLAKKYAKYRVTVSKDKDFKTYLATLEKAEDVGLLEEEKYTDLKGKSTEILKVKLADDSIGYIEPKHLGDSPIVFTADAKVFVRPTSGSTIYAVIPKGELGFIIAEKGLWVQVYVGKLGDKFISQQWVEGGYSNDPKLVLEAKQYGAAIAALNDKDAEKASQAKSVLETLAEGDSVIAGLAKDKLGIKSEKAGVENKSQNESENKAQ